MPGDEQATIALFLCSYRRDLLRAERLLRSVERHNVERMTVCVAVPANDLDLFKDKMADLRIRWLSQEEVLATDPRLTAETLESVSGSVRQQVVKAQAWRLGLAANLLVPDSDCVFLRPFGAEDFLDRDGVPWTLLDVSLLEAADRFALAKVRPDLERTMQPIRRFFGTEHLPPRVHGPAPFLWSSSVWKGMHDRWLKPRDWTCLDLIVNLRSEFLIYGEAARALACLPERTRGELFKCYHYVEQWWHDRLHGVTESEISRTHLGVVYQSNWEHEMDFGARKSPASRLARAARRSIRWARWRLQELRAPTPRTVANAGAATP